MNLDRMAFLLQSGTMTYEDMFSVTAAGGEVPPGLTVLDALCGAKGIRLGELYYSQYIAICQRVVKAASRMGMLNHMSGSRGDTPLMKACANGNDVMVGLLLTYSAGSSHLGLITSPVSLVVLSGLAS